MAKARLKIMTEDFINKKSGRIVTKVPSNKDTKRKRQNLHLSTKALKLLWQNRTETGETLSDTVERLILKYFDKKKK